MSSLTVEEVRGSVQPVISRNVKILMATKGLNQAELAEVLGLTPGAVQHKLAGRSSWTVDEIVTLAVYGGPRWPIARFLNDPESLEPTVATMAMKLRSISGEGRDPRPRSPLLATVGTSQ